MHLTDIHDHAIQARMALIVGAKTFDRLFAGVRFDEVDGDILFVHAKDEDTAAKIEDEFAHRRKDTGARDQLRDGVAEAVRRPSRRAR